MVTVQLTANEVSLIIAFGGASLSIAGSLLVARYTVKHSANYSEQITAINNALGGMAATQEEMRRQHAAAVESEKEHRIAEEAKVEAARWKPTVRIESKLEGIEQVNKLVLKDQDNFFLIQVSLLSPKGAQLEEYPMTPGVASKGSGVQITHASLNKLTSNNQQFFETGTFEGTLKYTVRREKDGATYSSDVPFHGERVSMQSIWGYKLSG